MVPICLFPALLCFCSAGLCLCSALMCMWPARGPARLYGRPPAGRVARQTWHLRTREVDKAVMGGAQLPTIDTLQPCIAASPKRTLALPPAVASCAQLKFDKMSKVADFLAPPFTKPRTLRVFGALRYSPKAASPASLILSQYSIVATIVSWTQCGKDAGGGFRRPDMLCLLRW